MKTIYQSAFVSFLLAGLGARAQVTETTIPDPGSPAPVIVSAATGVPLGVATNGVVPPTITWLPDEAELIELAPTTAPGIPGAVAPGVTIQSVDTNGQSVVTYVYHSSLATLVETTQLALGAAQSINSPQPLDSVGGCVRPGSGLIGWWQGENTSSDSAGTHPGQLMNNAGFAAGKVGQAFNLNSVNGQNQSVQIPYASGLMTTGLTIEVWVNPARSLASQAFVFGQAYGRQLVVQPASGGVNVAFYVTDSGGNFHGVVTTSPVPIGSWAHLAGTFDGASLKLYVNGALARSGAYSSALGDPFCPWGIGGLNSACGYSGQYFPGLIDEVSLYNRALLACEINAIYQAGAAGKCKTPQACDSAQLTPVASWPGEGDASDMFNNTYPGTLQNGVGFGQGMVARAFSFNPTNQQAVEMPSWPSVLTSPFSLEAWIKPVSQLGGAPRQAFILGQSYGSQLVVTNGLLGLRVGFILASSRTVFHELVSSGDIPLGQWSHLVAVYDGTAMSLFINGALDQQAAANLTPWDSLCPFHAGGVYDPSGACAFTGQYFNGLIDEATVYSQALTASDIQALYNAGESGKCGSLGYWLEYYFGSNCWNQTNATAGADADGDGVLNIQEYWNHTDPNKIQFSLEVTNEYVTTTTVPLQLNIVGGVPSQIAWMINDTDTTHANWQPYTGTNLNVTIGPADGTYTVWVGLKGLPTDAQQSWDGLEITLDRAAPVLAITNPILTGAAATLAKPYLQLAGWANEPLAAITCDLVNAAGTTTNLVGFVTDQVFDANRFNYTTTCFQCFDIPLTNGANAIALHATDLTGNVTTTNITVTLDYSTATPPAVSLVWPPAGVPLSGPTFYVRGRLSDETASVAAEVVDAGGNSTVVEGIVERNGVFWVEDLPLAAGASTVTLMVTNAAGNVTNTSMVVTQSDVTLTITSTPTDESLYQATGSICGYVSDPSYSVVVNGIPTTPDQWGNWQADNVPIRGQGTATFDVVASSGASTIATSAKPEMPAIIPIVDYRETKSDSCYSPGPPSGGGTHSRAKQVTATYQADPSGSWTTAFDGVVTDHTASFPNGDWSTMVYDWSNAGKMTHETASGNPPIDSTWDGISETYNQITGLPDQDLSCAAPGGGNPWWVYHYYADNVYHQWPQSDGSISAVAVLARTRQKLFTGGKSTVNRQNLFHINAWAQKYGKPPLAPWQYTPAEFVDPAKIQMLGHSLAGQQADGSGDLYLVLPDNVALDLNLRIPGVKHYNAVVSSLTKHLPCIKANNASLHSNDLAPGAQFSVGQKIVFSLEFYPDLPAGLLQTNQNEWHFTGKYVNAWEEYVPSIGDPLTGDYYMTTCYPQLTYLSRGQGFAVEDPPYCHHYQIVNWPLYQPATGAWWVSGGLQGVSCYPKLSFSNGQSASLIAHAAFKMLRPKVDGFTDYPPFTPMIANGWLELGLDNYLPAGNDFAGTMNFRAVVTTDPAFPGQVDWTQLANRSVTGLGPYFGTGGDYWLDNTRFWGSPATINPTDTIRFVDNPGVGTMGVIPISLTDQYKTYLMWNPGGDCIWVPLGLVTWGWSGTEWWGTTLTSSSVTPPIYADTDQFPDWLRTIHASTGQ